MRDGYYEKPSAPANLVLPKPVAIPRRKALSLILVGGGTGVITVGLTGCPQTASEWFTTVLADLPTILETIQGIITLAGASVVPPTLEAEIQKILNAAITDINLVQTLVSQYKTTPGATLLTQIDVALVDALNNLGTILSDFHVTDPILQSAISAALGLAITTILAIQGLVPAPTTATFARKSLGQNNGANVIKESFNFIVRKNYPKAVIA